LSACVRRQSGLGNQGSAIKSLDKRTETITSGIKRRIFRCYNYFFSDRIHFWSHALNRASAGLETIVARALHRAPPSQTALLSWPVACGSAVADRTRALDFTDGILRVEVADAGWRRELASLAPRYLALINKYSAAPVRRIEFVVKA
jgi:hypothetical protein